MNRALFIAFQRLVPQHGLSRLVGALASSQNTFIKNTFIQWFAKRYAVNMSEAAEQNPTAYASFNAFFTRALKPDARPICTDHNALISPADGSISQLGAIQDGRIFQAKGQGFTACELLGGDTKAAEPFKNGQFITVYLSPKDYHRVHMPRAGTLTRMSYIPGDLFSVNTVTAEEVPRLFARNERVVCHFETDLGPMVVVLVGAMIVASIEVPWAGVVAPTGKRIIHQDYGHQTPIALKKGEEMGRFLLGSTAIVLLPAQSLQWDATLTASSPVQMGQKIATCLT